MVLRVFQIVIVILIAIIAVLQIRDFIKNKEEATAKEKVEFGIIGFVVNFFDALGIGSFAPTLAIFHLTGLVEDDKIPGVLNVGVCIPVLLEALLFVNSVEVDLVTLFATVAAGIIGSFVGMRFNERIPTRGIRGVMGIGLAVAAVLMIGSRMGWLPGGGMETGLTGIKLAIAIIACFILGALLPLGVGHYAPCMVIVYLLGLSPLVAFPIMMSLGGLVCFCTTPQFFKSGKFVRQAAMGQTVGGAIGIFIAVYLVKSLPIGVLQWLVIIVVTYTSATMIHQAFKKEDRRKSEIAITNNNEEEVMQ